MVKDEHIIVKIIWYISFIVCFFYYGSIAIKDYIYKMYLKIKKYFTGKK